MFLRKKRRFFIAVAFVAIYLWNASTLHYHYYDATTHHRGGVVVGRNNNNFLRTNHTINQKVQVVMEQHDDGFLESNLFVINEAMLDSLKKNRPAIVNTNHHLDDSSHHHGDFTADVVSIGSNTRFHFLQAQVDTWSSHVNIRHFWGFTELQDFLTNCTASTTNENGAAHLRVCKESSRGWGDAAIEKFATKRYGETDGGVRRDGGWVCAQRRVGRALGWLHNQYRNRENGDDSMLLPDVLVLVDDDTALDMANLKKHIVDEEVVGGMVHGEKEPLVYAGCAFPKTFHLDDSAQASKGYPFPIPHGGFGTFFTKRAIQMLVQPVFCVLEEKESSKSNNAIICTNLKENRIGELAVFREGISILELFYRYSALRNFCMHSDWIVGYMIHFYLSPRANSVSKKNGQRRPPEVPREISRANPPLCGNVTGHGSPIPCTGEYIACHRQTPEDMESLAVDAFARSPGNFWKIPHLRGTEFLMGNAVPKK